MLKGRHIVVIEDDEIMGNSICQRLELEGAEVTWVKLMVRGISAVRTPRKTVDVVVCDIRLPDGTGEELYATLCRTSAPPPFLFITGQGDIDQAVRLLRAGASDYLTKPFDMAAFLERLALVMRSGPAANLPPLTGISPAARRVDAQASESASDDQPVLIRGEIGLGKAQLAHRIHELSDRRAAPFAEVNALRDKDADAALARAMAEVGEGTLYINGVGRLSRESQDRLLSALELGTPFRVVASVGTRIDEKVADGSFRADLLYRLMMHEIAIPPLTKRPDDAVWLAGQLFDLLNRRRSVPFKGISSHAEAAIRDHDWPGNGRELRARMLRAIEVADGEWLFPSDIFPELNDSAETILSLSQAREAAERSQILAALDRTNGQIAEAARLLKISRTTLWEKMQKLGL